MNDIPLQFKQVTKKFPYAKTQRIAINQLTLSINPGTVTGLLGPDGAGKTTLIRLAAGLLLPNAGHVSVFGYDTQKDPELIHKEIGYMPQHFGLYEDLSVEENLNLYADLQGLSTTVREQKQKELLSLAGLTPFRARKANDLSGGMKQKLGLACALLRAPQLLLLDEPTVGVDPISRRELWSIIEEIKKSGNTVLMSTAYFDEAERCDEIILLYEGKLLKKQSLDAFQSPLKNRTFFVTNPNESRRHLQEQLHQRDEVLDARIIVGGNRVLCSDTEPHPQQGEQWAEVTPSFEDAFVALLGKKQDVKEIKIDSDDTASQKSMVKNETIIDIENLNRFFDDFQAVKDVSFSVKQGEIFGILGANGAGKTTTFRMLCGLLRPSSGTLRVANVDMVNASSKARSRIGYVSQKFSLYGSLSLEQNLNFFSAAYGLNRKKTKERVQWALEKFELIDYKDINVDDLPLGIKQRLALSASLLHEPPILFLDEPTSGVDPLSRREFWQRINHLAQRGVTILITTHFMDEAEYCDHLVLMSLGEILAQGTPEEVRNKAKNTENPNPTMNDAFIYLIQKHEKQIRGDS